MNLLNVKAVVLDERCRPSYANPGDGGFDLRARVDTGFWLNPSNRVVVPVGLRIQIQPGFMGLAIPRSGLAKKHGITITNAPGLIDCGFRDELAIILQNDGHLAVEFKPFERIAQLAIVPVMTANFEFVEELDPSERGNGGFGSSGRA